ncbi:MAG: hypothetical protein QM790_17805 [Nibricoccus sp.]
MKTCFHILASTLLFSLVFTTAKAEESSAFKLPAEEPLAILSLPAGLDQTNVGVAVSKALVEEQWENLSWERNVTTATSVQSHVSIKVFAVATASDVKFYATYTSEKNTPEEKCRKITLRQLGYLEKTIATKLNLAFRKSKGDSNIDQAVAE